MRNDQTYQKALNDNDLHGSDVKWALTRIDCSKAVNTSLNTEPNVKFIGSAIDEQPLKKQWELFFPERYLLGDKAMIALKNN